MVALTWPMPFADTEIFGHSDGFDEEAALERDRINEQMTDLLAPLLRVQNRRELDRRVEYLEPEFSRLQSRSSQLFLMTADFSALKFKPTRDLLTQRVESFESTLGEEAASRLISALGSMTSLAEFTVEILSGLLKAGNDREMLSKFSALYTLKLEFTYGLMASSAVMGAIIGQFPDSDPKALRLLAIATDEFMTEVEDEFLATGNYDADEDEPGEPIDEVLRELGI